MACASKRVGLNCVLDDGHVETEVWHTDGLGNFWREPADLPKAV